MACNSYNRVTQCMADEDDGLLKALGELQLADPELGPKEAAARQESTGDKVDLAELEDLAELPDEAAAAAFSSLPPRLSPTAEAGGGRA